MDQMKIGKRIAELRKQKGFTQEVLAEKLHISSKSISRWESGRNMPDYALLEPLSSILGTDVASLLGVMQPLHPSNRQATVKAWLSDFLSPSLARNRTLSFAALTIAYLLIRYFPVWIPSGDFFLLFATFISSPLFGIIGYFIIQKKAFYLPLTAFFTSFILYFIIDIFLGNSLVSSFYLGGGFALWNFISVTASTLLTHIAYKYVFMQFRHKQKSHL